jgi:peptidyl-prolyl cis-trans isomerase A (cyclophilin A)
MMKKLLVFCCLLFCLTASARDKSLAIDPTNLYPKVKLETSMGVIVVELDRVRAPITVDNFLQYVVSGSYNNTIFHRVIEGFIVQGGGYDKNLIPLKDNGPIVNESGNGWKNEQYTIAMARENQPHTAKRQFFFNMADNKSLDPGRKWGYAVFGSVVEGEDILEKISQVKTDVDEESGWPDVPVEPVILLKATLLPAE